MDQTYNGGAVQIASYGGSQNPTVLAFMAALCGQDPSVAGLSVANANHSENLGRAATAAVAGIAGQITR